MKSFARMLILRPGIRFLAVEQRVGGGYLWNLPGGKIDGRETPKEAAVREVFEETGFLCHRKYVRQLCRRRISFGDEVWMGHFYVYSGPLFAMEIREPEKILDLRWLEVDEARCLQAHHGVFTEIFELALARLPIGHDPWTNQKCVELSRYSRLRRREDELISAF